MKLRATRRANVVQILLAEGKNVMAAQPRLNLSRVSEKNAQYL